MKMYALQIMRRKCDSRIDPNWPGIGKNGNDVTIFRHDVIAKFFWRCFVSLVMFSYRSNFHLNIITKSGVMKIVF